MKSLRVPNLKIKWPNDIMSGNSKICGILNETKVKGSFIESFIIGFGINVNQENFIDLPNASSLKLINNIDYDLEGIVSLIFQNLKKHHYLSNALKEFSDNEFQKLNHQYHLNLYRRGEFSQFINKNKEFFFAKILEVNKKGIIKIQKEDKTIMTYNFQEIQMIIE
jgi:BirA family biotin operon repressor/biotin-[acetyl-CoA-carboxylase] ligase